MWLVIMRSTSVLVLTGWLTFACSNQTHGQQEERPPYLDLRVRYDGFLTTTDTRLVPIELNCLLYHIPANYISYLGRLNSRSGCDPTAPYEPQGVTIVLLLPDFEGLTENNYNLMRRTGDAPTIAISIQETRDANASLQSVRTAYHDVHNDPNNPRFRMHGLICSESVEMARAQSTSDLCLLPDDELDVFRCSNEELYPNPQCTHWFAYSGLRIQIRYQRKFLPQWRRIKTRVQETISNMAEKGF